MLHRRDLSAKSRSKIPDRSTNEGASSFPLSLWERVGVRVPFSSCSQPSKNSPHPAFGHPLPGGEGRHRRGFTLVELLVSISILLILSVITLATINMTQTYDRIRTGTRQVQSYYEGAKTRAGYAKDIRGVRFLLDTTDNTTASSMVFIGPPERFSQGQIVILREDDPSITTIIDLNRNGTIDDPVTDTVFINYPPIWNSLASRNRLSDGARIKIRDSYFTIAQWKDPTGSLPNQWYLTRPYRDQLGVALEYELELNPAVLPNQEPRPLGTGIVIDLDNSRVPGTWRTGGAGSAYTQYL
ncbi:MAG: prepilin-type N-terminal cleavage/methylation domain-containing protein, partial [Planctomycetota bacterium]|nr:prepilin-type N-terminal cleavage/methylation domain-containing protein [Planctomycetota bacterium]